MKHKFRTNRMPDCRTRRCRLLCGDTGNWQNLETYTNVVERLSWNCPELVRSPKELREKVKPLASGQKAFSSCYQEEGWSGWGSHGLLCAQPQASWVTPANLHRDPPGVGLKQPPKVFRCLWQAVGTVSQCPLGKLEGMFLLCFSRMLWRLLG